MAEILGLVAGFLGPALELGKCFAEPIKRQFNYLCCFNSNVQNLRDEAQKLEDTRSGLQMKVDAEENNAQVVVPEVKTWFNDVDGIQAKNTEIEAEITTFRQNGCFAVKSRYTLGKKVKKTAEAMKDLREEGSKFTIIATPPPPAAVAAPIPLGSNIFEFDSRKGIEEETIDGLKDENVNKLGICGMGGVGKTTMAKRIMHRVREEHLFDEIVMAVVSQKLDKLGIQGVIAKDLGLEFEDKESVQCRARDLHVRLTRGTKRTLIVLDDVWEVLNLEELGIPCDSGCKILLTSRDKDIFKRMKVENVSAVRVLSKIEAWDLFRSEAGSCIEQENAINGVAQEVVNECKGLPIALVTVGVALKDEVDIREWNHALNQLKGANPNHMPEVIEAVYKPLRFSYESLKSVDHKSLFLLCCLFPEDYDIPLEDLAMYAMGLRMFGDIRSLEGARETVFSLVKRLKSCFLLLEGKYENHVKMHDVVRDVAIFIASDERLINCEDCTWIASYSEERFGIHMGSVVYPNPHLLLIDHWSRDTKLEMDDDFFEGMEELNVLSIEYPSLRQLPKTTKLMINLKTLILVWCEHLESISVVGELVNLEILICDRCELIECLPIEMAGISRLRLLKLSNCKNLKTIAPGIISNQRGLEELIVVDFDNWEEADEGNREKKNASLSELEHLSSLTRLQIKIKDYTYGVAAAWHKLPPNMVKYDITIGDDDHHRFHHYHDYYVMYLNVRGEFNKNALKLTTFPGNNSLGKWIHECVRIVEYMRLERFDDSSLDFGAAHNMRSLTLKDCSAVKKLVDVRSSGATVFPLLEHLNLEQLRVLEVICNVDGPMQSNSFNKLSTICIYQCRGLRSLFSFSVMARSSWFAQLESLEIWGCDMMEQVFLWNEEENQTNIHIPLVFPKLKKLKLFSLKRLTSFSRGIFQSIEFPLLEEMYVQNCPLQSFVFTACSTRSPDDDDSRHLFGELDKVKFGSLKVVQLEECEKGQNTNCSPQIPIDFFDELRKLTLSGFKSLKSLFSLSMIESNCLLQLEELTIDECDVMEQVLQWNGEENQRNNGITLQFPKLKLLELSHMPKLTSFSKGFQSIEFPLLEKMKVQNCPLPSLVFTACSTRSPDDNDSIHFFGELDKVKFGSLKLLKLSGCESLKSLFSLSMIESGCLLQLEELEIEKCDVMEQVLQWNGEENQRINGITLQFPKLKLLELSHMPTLRSFSKGLQSIEFPLLEKMEVQNCPLQSLVFTACSTRSPDDNDSRHIFGELDKVKFGSLKLLKLSGCESLKSLFSLSMIESGCLLQLEELEIEKCDVMEQVLQWNGEENQRINGITLQFPKLKLLKLSHMPTLTSFSKGFQSIEFPLLEKMEVQNCPLQSFVFTACSTRSPDDDDSRHFFGELDKVKFGSLKILNLSGFKSLKSLFSLSMIESGCLLQLEKLEIEKCDVMEQVLQWNGEENQRINGITLQFPKLKLLKLSHMPTLRSFSKGFQSIEFPLLEKMEVHNCPLLKGLVSSAPCDDHDEISNIQFFSKESCVSTSTSPTGPPHDNDDSMHLFCKSNKVEFGNLKELSIGDYDSVRNWCGQIPIDFFAVLRKLKVSRLKGMNSLFPCSIARNLRNLVELNIQDCEEMVKVIEDEEDDALQISLFPNLKRLFLANLKKLKCFCEWRCTLQLPKLDDLWIKWCDVMDEFTLGALNTPNLKVMHIDHDYCRHNEVNKELQQRRLEREEQLKTQLEESSSAEADSTN